MKENQTNERITAVLHDRPSVSLAEIQSRIYTMRNMQVMIDRDLALLYGVENRALKQAVRRNPTKFPDDFMLRLTENESNNLISIGVSQIVIPPGYNTGGSDMFAFTEQGVAMLATVLKSQRAADVSISIMRAFVAMRRFLTGNAMPFSSRKQPIHFIIIIRYETTQARMFKKKKNGCAKNAPAAAGSRGRSQFPFYFRRGAVRRGSNIKHQNSL